MSRSRLALPVGTRILPALPLSLSLLLGCFAEPPPSLRTQMIEQEIAVDSLEKALEAGGDPAAIQVEARRISAVSQDEAFERFRKRSAVKPRLREFDAFRAEYVQHSEALEAAAEAEDIQAVAALIQELRASCDACHAVFRPGL